MNELFSTSLKRFNPQYWLPFLTLIWGIVSVAQGLVKNQAGMFAVRFCERLHHQPLAYSTDNHSVLGMTEAGLYDTPAHKHDCCANQRLRRFPGVIYVFSVYYRRYELLSVFLESDLVRCHT